MLAESNVTANTRIGRMMFFDLLVADILEAHIETPMHLLTHRSRDADAAGSASASSRAATLTPSPAMSLPSTMMSPKLIPMRNSMRSSDGFD